jgi:hypothetical protein
MQQATYSVILRMSFSALVVHLTFAMIPEDEFGRNCHVGNGASMFLDSFSASWSVFNGDRGTVVEKRQISKRKGGRWVLEKVRVF